MARVPAAQDELSGQTVVSTVSSMIDDTESILERCEIRRVSNQEYVFRLWYLGDDEYEADSLNSFP